MHTYKNRVLPSKAIILSPSTALVRLHTNMNPFKTLFVLACLALAVVVSNAAPGGLGGHGAESYLESNLGEGYSGGGGYAGGYGHEEHYPDHHPKYSYKYGVSDGHTGDFKDAQEQRDGDTVHGEYSLLQPDGRKRTVHYTADKHGGFNAHVSYSGHADHPQQLHHY